MASEKPWYDAWPESVRKKIDLPPHTLPEMLVQGADGQTNSEAIFSPDASYTYSEVLERVRATAGYLSEEIDVGGRVALYMHNAPEFVFALYGALLAGGCVVLVDPSTQGRDLEYELTAADVDVVVTDADVANDDPTIYDEYGASVIDVDGGSGQTSFEDVLDSEPVDRDRQPDDDAIIFYYAGVAEKSQPLYHTHRSIVASERIVSEFKRIDDTDVGITTAPMTHGLGLFTTIEALHNGATVGMMPRFDVDTAIEYLRDRDVTYIEGGPPVYKQLVENDGFSKDIADSIDWCLAAGAPLPEEIHETFVTTSGAPLLQLYGLTEAPNVAMTPLEDARYGSMGIPLPNTDVKVVDPEDWGDEQPIGEQGELLVDTPAAMRAYESEADTEMVTDGRWLATGDLVVMDEDGFLFFRGTRKRVINYKGYPILPRDLEEVLSAHENVTACRIEAEADDDVGQIPVAKVVVDTPIDADELSEYVNNQVSAYKQIRRIDFVDSLD